MIPIYQFEIHTKTKMYSIMAAYFVANRDGVLFFDDKQKGIGFVSNVNLEFVRLTQPKPVDINELMGVHNKHLAFVDKE